MTSEERKEGRYQRRCARREAKRRARSEACGSFEQVFSYENLYKAGLACCKGVRWKCSTQRYLASLSENTARTRKALMDGTWKTMGFHEFDIMERGKLRHIRSVHISERVVQRCLCDNALVPLFSSAFIYDNAASLKGKGIDFAMGRMNRHLQRHYRKHGMQGGILVFDFTDYFNSAPQEPIHRENRRRLYDERVRERAEIFMADFGERGFGLGSQVSQIDALMLANGLDHFIKEQLKAVHYIRYMDDMVVFGKNKKELHRMQQEIERFLREKFNLQMKGNWQVFRFDYTEKKTGKRKGRPLDFMGFQFYHDKTILRESIMLSCTRKVNRVAKKEKITWYDATAILSYMGYLSNTDTYDMYLQRVKPYVNVKKLKKIVSKHSKRKEREKHERMERSVRNGGRTAGGVRHNSVTDNGISETQYQESNERGCRRKENHRMAARGA